MGRGQQTTPSRILDAISAGESSSSPPAQADAMSVYKAANYACSSLLPCSNYSPRRPEARGIKSHIPLELFGFFPNGGPVLKQAFLFARAVVTEHGFSHEVDWQDSVSLDLLTENTFLQEYAWVVLASGMREAVVRKKFPKISQCFYFWSSAEKISDHAEECIHAALRVFRHEAKMRAVVYTAGLIAAEGFRSFKEKLDRQPLQTLEELPYIGPITQFHLAKNIGLNVAKPDRHLVRIAQLFGYATAQDFCLAVARQTGSKIAVADLVFWRFATLQRNYIEVFRQFIGLTEQSPLSRLS